MRCFYHSSDMDGKCSAAIILSRITSCKIIPIDYNKNFPYDTILPNEKILVVDFNCDFEKLLEITKDIIWIDHHETAINQWEYLGLDGIRDNKKAACELVWNYCFPNKKIPYSVKYIANYDIWDFNMGDNTEIFQCATMLYDTSPSSSIWENWLNIDYFPLDELKLGKITKKYRDNYYKSLVGKWRYFTTFEGYKIVACNAGSVSSQLFDSIEEDYDIMCPFIFDGKQWIVSLYTKKDIDVSEIAKKYGGGGHKQAAGFSCKELPFSQ